MTLTAPHNSPDDPARMARGWDRARVWMSALLAMLNLTANMLPDRLDVTRQMKLDALKQIRLLEALIRRLVLAMATQAPWPAMSPHKIPHPHWQNPPATGRAMITLDPARLGLAHYRAPEPEPETQRAPRKPIAPTISLIEAWPDMRICAHDGRPPNHVFRAPATGPRILSLDADWIAPSSVRRADDASTSDTGRMLKRIRALRAVMDDPARMVRRMAGWLARRNPDAGDAYRPHPLSIGLPRYAMTDDQHVSLHDLHTLARSMLWRRDTS